jgi:enoyl-[acyl-carrier protein] reductase II
MRTRVTELLGIRYPIIQGGMAWVSTAPLVTAVSEAGGLGVIGSGGMNPEELRDNIRQVKSTTNKPFGVNLMLLSPFIEDQIKVVKEEKVPVVTTGAGNPSRLIDDFSNIGIITIPVVASVLLAKRLLRHGIPAVIAEGMESGGHIGDITTLCLIPQMVDALDIPVIAAGGVGDGRGMAACFALGAEGVQIGTRFVCSYECEVHPSYKEAILHSQDRSTVMTGMSTGHPVRCLKNKLTRKFEELESLRVSREEIEALGSGRLRKAVCEGDVEEGSVMAGQIAGLIHDIKSVSDIIQDIMTDFQMTIRRMASIQEQV